MSFRSHNNNSSSKKRKHSASSSSSSESVATSSSSSSASDRNSNTNSKKRGAPSSPSAASSSSSSSPSSLPSSLKKARMMSSGSSASPSRTPMNGPQRKQPVKKLTIKGLSVRPQLPQDFEQTTWEKLKLAVQAVHKKQPVHYGEEELYKATENLCSNKLGGSLYKKIEAECKLHVQEVLSRLLAQAQNSQQLELEGSFLYLVNNCWKDHCANMLFIRSIFLYLDRTYVLQNAEVCSLWDMGLNQFRDHIAVHPQVKGRVVSGILTLIEKERLGETVDRMLLKSLSDMFIALQIYMTELEPVFLRASESFYAKEGSQCILDMETADYLKHVEERLRHEEQRIQHYLSEVTKRPLISVVEKQLIAAHVDTLIAKGTNFLFENDRREDLTRMYSLFLRVQALPQLKTAWTAYIKSAGTDIVMDEERDALMVQRLLDFRAKLMLILHQAFRDEPSFTHAVKEAFEAFVNVRRTRPAELIAKFVDSKLRSGNKAASEEELDGLMDQVVTIFRYLNGKDVFEAFYKKDLAKRLLLNKSASIDAEKSMVSKLKIECGSVFTSKLEGMFKDVELSKDIMNSFRQSAKHMEQLGKEIELNVHVLTTGCWPAYTPIEIKLPQQLSHCQEVFREFYTSKYSGRRLLWQNSLGSCTLRAAFPKGRKELSVSLFQTVILLLFNDTEAMSYADIAEATGLEEKELKRTLQSLACGRVRVLLKRPKGKEVEKEDVFHYNKEFRQKLYRIKINSIQMKETEEENTKTKESVFQDRQYQIDAAIVRIMKMRKTLSHNLLMSELYQQLKFPLKPADVKKRIESLIDRDYLERDSKNASLYNYLA